MTPQTQAPNPLVLNANQRAAVLAAAVDMKQQIFSQTIAAPATQGTINIQPRNVGLIKRFLIEVTASITNTDGALDATLTDFGVANLLSQVTFTDLNNNTRIQTTGWHLHMVAASKYQWPLGSAILNASATDAGKFGDNFAVIKEPATVAHGAGATTLRVIYEVPLAYSDDDLRGAVYANVVNATMNLGVTINPTPSVAVNVDSTNAIYKGTVNCALSNVNITVYQVYLDQLPVSGRSVILPAIDLATVYELKNTTFTNLAAGQEFPIPYANFRDFLSTFAVYNHDTSADVGRVGGTDINYWALQSANFTNLWKQSPEMAALEVRKILQQDLPLGCYYFSSRRKPISTTTYGNMELIINPLTAAAGNYVLVGWESFALTGTLTGGAGSLAAS